MSQLRGPDGKVLKKIVQPSARPSISNVNVIGKNSIDLTNITVAGQNISIQPESIAYLDVDTAGVAESSKAVVVDGNNNIQNIGDMGVEELYVNGVRVTGVINRGATVSDSEYMNNIQPGIVSNNKIISVDEKKEIKEINLEAKSITYNGGELIENKSVSFMEGELEHRKLIDRVKFVSAIESYNATFETARPSGEFCSYNSLGDIVMVNFAMNYNRAINLISNVYSGTSNNKSYNSSMLSTSYQSYYDSINNIYLIPHITLVSGTTVNVNVLKSPPGDISSWGTTNWTSTFITTMTVTTTNNYFAPKITWSNLLSKITIAIGNKLYVSDDGTTWTVTSGTIPVTTAGQPVIYHNSYIAAFTYASNIVYFTTDGINWSNKTFATQFAPTTVSSAIIYEPELDLIFSNNNKLLASTFLDLPTTGATFISNRSAGDLYPDLSPQYYGYKYISDKQVIVWNQAHLYNVYSLQHKLLFSGLGNYFKSHIHMMNFSTTTFANTNAFRYEINIINNLEKVEHIQISPSNFLTFENVSRAIIYDFQWIQSIEKYIVLGKADDGYNTAHVSNLYLYSSDDLVSFSFLADLGVEAYNQLCVDFNSKYIYTYIKGGSKWASVSNYGYGIVTTGDDKGSAISFSIWDIVYIPYYKVVLYNYTSFSSGFTYSGIVLSHGNSTPNAGYSLYGVSATSRISIDFNSLSATVYANEGSVAEILALIVGYGRRVTTSGSTTEPLSGNLFRGIMPYYIQAGNYANSLTSFNAFESFGRNNIYISSNISTNFSYSHGTNNQLISGHNFTPLEFIPPLNLFVAIKSSDSYISANRFIYSVGTAGTWSEPLINNLALTQIGSRINTLKYDYKSGRLYGLGSNGFSRTVHSTKKLRIEELSIMKHQLSHFYTRDDSGWELYPTATIQRSTQNKPFYKSLCYSRGVYAICSNGKIFKGKRINKLTETNLTGSWNSIASAKGVFVVVGNNAIAVSVDRTNNWVQMTGTVVDKQWNYIHYSQDLKKWVACANDAFAVSIDAVNWNVINVEDCGWKSVKYTNGHWLAVGLNKIAYCLDINNSINLTFTLFNLSGDWRDSAFGGQWILTGRGKTALSLGYNSLTDWETQTELNSKNFNSVIWVEGLRQFFLAGQSIYTYVQTTREFFEPTGKLLHKDMQNISSTFLSTSSNGLNEILFSFWSERYQSILMVGTGGFILGSRILGSGGDSALLNVGENILSGTNITNANSCFGVSTTNTEQNNNGAIMMQSNTIGKDLLVMENLTTNSMAKLINTSTTTFTLAVPQSINFKVDSVLSFNGNKLLYSSEDLSNLSIAQAGTAVENNYISTDSNGSITSVNELNTGCLVFRTETANGNPEFTLYSNNVPIIMQSVSNGIAVSGKACKLDSNKDLSGVNTLNSAEINFGIGGVYRLQKIEPEKTPAVVFQSTQSSLEGSGNTAWDACYHHELDMYVCATNIGEFTTTDNPERHYLLISKDGINWNKQFTGLYALINKIIPLYSTGFTGASNYIGNSLGVAGFLLLISSGNHISKRIFTPDCINYYLINTTVTADTFDAIYDSNTRLFINDNSNYSNLVPIIVNRFATTTAKFYNISDITGVSSQLSPFGTGMTDTDIKYCQYSGAGINCLIGNDLKLANTSSVASSALGETANDMVYAFRLDGTSSNYDYIIACNGGKIIYNNVSNLNSVPAYNAARTTLVINAAVNFTCCEYNQSLRRFLLGASDGKIYISDVGSKIAWSLVSTPVHLNNSWVKIRSCQSKGFLIWHDDSGSWDKSSSKICRVDETGMFKIMYNSIFRSTRDGAYGKGLYVVPILDGGNSNKIMYSDDGINWRYTFQSSAGIGQVIYVSHLNTFVCRTGRLIYSSPDGISWTLIYTHTDVSAQSNGMVYSEERQLLVLVFRNITAANILTTSDLTTFNTYSKVNHQYLSYLCYSPEADKFIFGSEENRLIPMFYTTDFTTFADCVSLESDSATVLPLGRYMKYLYSSKELVVRNIYTGKQWYSTDAVNWKRFDGFIDYNNYSAKSFDSPSVFIENIGDVIIHGESPDGPSIVNISNRMYKIIGAIGGGIRGNDMICTIWNKEDRKLLTYKGSEGSRKGEYFQLIDLQDYENKITKEIPIDYFNKVYSDRKNVSEYLDINNMNQISTTSLDGGIENKENIISNINTWRSVRYTVSSTPNWQSVCWSSELKIAVAIGGAGTGRICISYDLLSWEQFAAPEDSNLWRSICWSPELNLFVAVASSGTNRIMTSSDGIIWTARNAPNTAASWISVCWSQDLSIFVAVSNSGAGNRVATSSDGINWTMRISANDTYAWQSVCWSPELTLFVAVQTGPDNSVMTSPDGINWTLRKIPAGYTRLVSVCWSQDLNIFVACADSTNPNRIINSKDGINWQPVVNAEANTMGNFHISWNSALKCFFTSCQSGTNKSLVSYDGIYWFNYTTPNDVSVTFNCSCSVPEYNMQIMVGTSNSITTFTNNKFSIKYTPSFKDVKVWNDVYWCNDLSLFIGFEGSTGQPTSNVSKIHTSSDGVSWQSREIHNNFNTWNSVCWSPQLSRLVAVSSGGIGAFAYSSNGISWNSANNTTLIDANSWRGVCWSPELNLFVAVAFAGANRVATSTDGINWTLRASAVEANAWRSVCWSSYLSLFVAVSNSGTNRVMTSPDGITWTARASASETVAWNTICWSPTLNLFVAVGSSGIMTSTNGTTFTLIANTALAFSMVKWIESKNIFMASISSSSSNLLYFSTDGIVWKAYVAKSNQYISSFDYSPSSGKLVVVGNGGFSYFSHIDNYEKLVMTTTTTNMDTNTWISSCWSPSLNLFVAVANGGTNRVATSPDGFNWTLRTANPDASTWVGVCRSEELNLFVAVANSGTTRLMTSSDGITWTVRTPSSNTNNWASVCWSPELTLFVAVSGSGTNRVMTSPDGINWTARTSATEANSWKSVCWSPELSSFVAVATSGTNRVMTSPDGVIWSARTSATEANNWNSVCWSPELSLFVAVASTGVNRISTSSNGINWKSSGLASVTDTNAYTNVLYVSGLNMLIACGVASVDRIIVSFDGINWYKQSSLNDTNSWHTLAYSSSLNRIICLSADGTNRVMVLEDKQLPTSNGFTQQTVVVNDLSSINFTYPTSNLANNIRYAIARSDSLNIFVTVSYNGTNRFAYSQNGESWTQSVSPNDGAPWFCVEWSPVLNLFIALSYGGINQFAYSTDGINWALGNIDNDSWSDLCWSSGLNKFVAVSRSTNKIAMTSDGITWTYNTINLSSSWQKIIWLDNVSKFMITSHDGAVRLAYSSDAITWTATSVSTSVYDVAYSHDLSLFVACGSGMLYSSSDGINWSSINIAGESANLWSAIKWIPQRNIFITVAQLSGSPTSNRYMISRNGIDWSKHISTSLGSSWYRISYSLSLNKLILLSSVSSFIAVVSDATTYSEVINTVNYLSTNTIITGTAANYNTESKSWTSIVWSPQLSRFVAVGSSIIMYSSDGNEWLPSFSSDINKIWQSVCWSSELNLFVAVSSSGSKRVATSSNGIDWVTRLSSDETSAWQSVCWSAELSLFVSIANAGTVARAMTSVDGINWTSRTIDIVSAWRTVKWIPSLSIFMAGSYQGTNKIATSINGINWTLRTTPSAVWDFDYSPQLSRFVSVGMSQLLGIQYSNDGITWNQSVNTDSTINTIDYYNIIWVQEWSMFIASSASGFAISSNGIRWYRRNYSLIAVSPMAYSQSLDKICTPQNNTFRTFYSLTLDMINIIMPYEVKWNLAWNKSMQNFLAIKNTAPLLNDTQIYMSKDGYVWNFNSTSFSTTLSRLNQINSICDIPYTDTTIIAKNALYIQALSGLGAVEQVLTSIPTAVFYSHTVKCILACFEGSNTLNTYFVSAAGQAGNLITSFTLPTSVTIGQVFMCNGNHVFVPRNKTNTIYVSRDLNTYTTVLLPSTGIWKFDERIVRGYHKRAVGVSSSGLIIYSDDGINWNLAITTFSAGTRSFANVRYITAFDVFIACDIIPKSNPIVYSSDGSTWNPVSISNNNIIVNDVAFSPLSDNFIFIVREANAEYWGIITTLPKLANSNNVIRYDTRHPTNNSANIFNLSRRGGLFTNAYSNNTFANPNSEVQPLLAIHTNSAYKPTTSAWTVQSDFRLKENIVNADLSRCLEIVDKLDLKHYKWKDEFLEKTKEVDKSQLGWIAQEVEEVMPKAVVELGDMFGIENIKTLNKDQIIAVLYGAVQKLIERYEMLDKELKEL